MGVYEGEIGRWEMRVASDNETNMVYCHSLFSWLAIWHLVTNTVKSQARETWKLPKLASSTRKLWSKVLPLLRGCKFLYHEKQRLGSSVIGISNNPSTLIAGSHRKKEKEKEKGLYDLYHLSWTGLQQKHNLIIGLFIFLSLKNSIGLSLSITFQVVVCHVLITEKFGFVTSECINFPRWQPPFSCCKSLSRLWHGP